MSSTPDPITQLISDYNSIWNTVSSKSRSRLFQLALLRELYGKLHAMKSSFLARRDFVGVEKVDHAGRSIQNWAFKTGTLEAYPENLLELAEGAPQVDTGHPPHFERLFAELPANLVDALGRERLERGVKQAQQGIVTDRPWELILVHEAWRAGLEFWSLNVTTPIQEAEHLQESAAASLWPYGILLSTRTLGIHSDTRTWEGQWQIAMESGSSMIRNQIQGHWTSLA